MSTVAIIDYGAGNLHSAVNGLRKVADADDKIVLTRDAAELHNADRVVLPGVGAYAACRAGLDAIDGMIEALNEFKDTGRPFMGICVGMQLLVQSGLEHDVLSPGLGWLSGDVRRINPNNDHAKIPHMGWNELTIHRNHPVLDGISGGQNVYFVHSYAATGTKADEIIASTDYFGDVVAAIGRDNIFGTQFHPEKSQTTGLGILKNFLGWKP